jgi:hypothetical protein
VSDGRGVLAIQISNEATLTTVNTEFAEKFGHQPSLIAVGSALYKQAIQLQVGQKVRFSGKLYGSSDDCVHELSLTPEGGMSEPEILTRFDAIKPAE